MDTSRVVAMEPVVTLAELAEHLHVSVQTLYDLRCQGRGPRAFRVGRELHVRISEVEAWLARLEAEDTTGDTSGDGAGDASGAGARR
ncbi:helix-turn-helix transcriptional regulator [Nocardioides soli]|uniref:Putative DNA-binding transcriptional regulator AlpA n=1 Tax=Nocardioides soli TaxID=1036020 RepID=A0A7W4VYK9_9ACTN|nr:helix-turn-helix domain-containing protein [Nocardioides soli]MBB3043692.1 putative DNA-binding transcriptional regulator AlpA [Nocardioides soli]